MSYRIDRIVCVFAIFALALGSQTIAKSPYQKVDQTARGGAAMTAAATAWLATLDKDQKETAQLVFDNPKRFDWHFIPKRVRKGLTLRDMNEKQRPLAMAIVESATSGVGYKKLTAAMKLETILWEQTKHAAHRDPLKYYFTIFGEPAAKGTWALSFEGHHMSSNFVVRDNKLVSVTPMMLGANPSIVTNAEGTDLKLGWRPLEKEETLAFALVNALNKKQQAKAITAAKSPRDLKEGGSRKVVDTNAAGLPGSEMTQDQRSQLLALIKLYVTNAPSELSGPYLKKLKERGLDNVRFAWAGATKPDIGHSYRIYGQDFVILLYNTQNDTHRNRARHVHAVWRVIGDDFAGKK